MALQSATQPSDIKSTMHKNEILRMDSDGNFKPEPEWMTRSCASKCRRLKKRTPKMVADTNKICHRGERCTAKKTVASPALMPPPRLYRPWQVLIILR